MLKGINPLLSPELLKLLCEMGHGDEIVLADANFTAESLGRGKTVLRLPGVSTRADAIVQTGELQAWSNFVFRKGVIAEDLRA